MDYSAFFSQIVKKRNTSEDKVFRKASKKDIDYLKSSKYPDCIVQFYSYMEPRGYVEINGVRLGSINSLKVENEDGVPVYPIYNLGFRAVATTKHGDVFCINVKKKMNKGQPFIYILSHEENTEDFMDKIESGEFDEDNLSIEKVTDSFEEFLEKFINEKLPDNFYDFIQSPASKKNNTKRKEITIIPERMPNKKVPSAIKLFYMLDGDDKYPPVDCKKNFYDVECPVFPDHFRTETKDEPLRIVTKKKKMSDFVTTWHSDWMINDKTAELFKKLKLSGYKLREVDVSNKELPFKLWEIVVVSKAKTHPDSGMKVIYDCEHCGILIYSASNESTGIIIDKNTWDGSDFFTLEENSLCIFVTEKVKKVIEDNRLTGVRFKPPSELQFGFRSEDADQSWSKEQWKEYFDSK